MNISILHLKRLYQCSWVEATSLDDGEVRLDCTHCNKDEVIFNMTAIKLSKLMTIYDDFFIRHRLCEQVQAVEKIKNHFGLNTTPIIFEEQDEKEIK